MKKTIIIASILSIAILTACLQEEPIEPSADSVLDDQIFQIATSTQDLEKCNEILSSTKKEECKMVVESLKLTDEAVKSADQSVCNKIKDQRYKENCISRVQDEIDYQNRAEKYREDIQKQQEENLSIETKALEAEDADICNDIDDENVKYSCRYNVLIDQAIEKNDPSICEDIGEEIFIEKCKEEISL